MKCNISNCLCFLSDHFVKTVNIYKFMKMMTSQITQVTWLISKLFNSNNSHVSRNLRILIVVLVELEQKTKLTSYWPVYGLVDDVTTTLYHTHIIV